MSHQDLTPIYRGSVKDVLGPLSVAGTQAVMFKYTDAYSVFDWGKMPDALAGKGQALAILAAHWFESIESHEIWKEFSRSPEALGLRKGNRFGSSFNELGEQLQAEGLRTHYLGVVPKGGNPENPKKLSEVKPGEITPELVVRQVSVVPPKMAQVLGRRIPDYSESHRVAPGQSRLVPLEVVFRFSCPEGSSLLERATRDPEYLASRGFGDVKVAPGVQWEFPVLEMFSKLESTDRPLTLSEALAISGLTGQELDRMLLKTAWVAGLLRWLCKRSSGKVELADGKLEWGVDSQGKTFLVDAVGPDELRLLKGGVQLSKEFLRAFYRDTAWYEQVSHAKKSAATKGTPEWRKMVGSPPPHLNRDYLEAGSQLYQSLTNALSGKAWFSQAWSLDRVTEVLQRLTAASSGGGGSSK